MPSVSVHDWLNFDDYEFQDNDEINNELPPHYLPKESVNALLPMQRINKKGIVDECCRKSCSYENLRMYCGK